MRTIHKYHLNPSTAGMDPTEILVPSGAKLLTVMYQHDAVRLWFEVETDNKPESRKFVVLPTGVEFEFASMEYRGTLTRLDGRLVWHIYELTS